MKTLVKLTAILTETDWAETRRNIAALHHEISPGVFIHLGLGPAGLQIFHGEKAVAIPLDELVNLARAHEPAIGADPATPIAPITRTPRAAPAVSSPSPLNGERAGVRGENAQR